MRKIIIDLDKLNNKLDFIGLEKVKILDKKDYDFWRKTFPNIYNEYNYLLVSFPNTVKTQILLMYEEVKKNE